MADSWSKKQRRKLRELQGLAWERELEEALRPLHKEFERRQVAGGSEDSD